VVVNGLVTLGALALWGSLYLPGVHAACAEAPEGPPAGAP
jgi:hypothetical protein